MARPRSAGLVRMASELVLAALALGVVTGVLWRLLAPEIQGEVGSSGVAGSAVEARRQFGVDGWFTIAAAVGGLALGAIGFVRHRRRPVSAVFVLAFAGLLGALVQWRLGVLLGPESVAGRSSELPTGTRVSMPLELAAPGALLVWPIAALVAAVVVAAVGDDRRPWVLPVSRRDRSALSSQQ